jgi:myo-inositol 2-dehydrogenase / D-chiro-inositol 1-dehydrogenase
MSDISNRHPGSEPKQDRRDFLKTTVAAGSAAAAVLSVAPAVHASNNDVIRVGLVGCGGRGTGAAAQCVRGGQNVKLWAMGDAFPDRLSGAINELRNRSRIGDLMDVPESRQFVGLDAYKDVIANCDLVILATPPGFRPIHLQAAVNANKHIFTEKPVAVDGPGVRTVLGLYEEANRRGLCVVAGLQRHYQTGYLQALRRIHDGEIGTITSARCYWNQGRLWNATRTASMSDVEWQIRNWLYLTWLSGDHICEQHVHNLDVVNWALQAHPTRCVGMGGRQVRTAPEFGHIFDHFAVEYEYPNDVHVLSMCRQIEGCAQNVSEAVTGTRGTWSSPNPSDTNFYRIKEGSETRWAFHRRDDNEPYQKEHDVLIYNIRQGTQINNLRYVAESTLTAIMGRMSTYTGRAVTWNEALNSNEVLMPQHLALNMSLAVPPVAMPGSRA